MVSLTDGILRVVRQPDAPPEDGDDASDPVADSWPTLHKNALYGLAGVLTLAIDPYTEADPVAMLLNILTAFGNEEYAECSNRASPHNIEAG